MENIEMNRIGTFRSVLVALIPIVAIAFGSAALAQTPAPAAISDRKRVGEAKQVG